MTKRSTSNLQGRTQCVRFTPDAEAYRVNRGQLPAALREIALASEPVAPLYIGGIIDLRGNPGSVIGTHRQISFIPAEAGIGEISSP